MRCNWLTFALGLVLASNAHAQSSFTNSTYSPLNSLNQNFGPLPAVNPAIAGVAIGTNALINPSALQAVLPLSAFASEQDLSQTNQNVTLLNQNLAQINQNLTQADQTLSSAILQNTQAIAGLNQSIRHAESRASQGVAAVSSVAVVPPNPGDRFSVTFGGGDYGSEGGGGISFSYRPPEAQSVMVFAGYARTADTNLFKGGVSFSFH
jgi:hypothetical protein